MRRARRRVSTGWRGAAHLGAIRTRPKGLAPATVRATSSENSTHTSTSLTTTGPWRPKWWMIAAGILLLVLHEAAVNARSTRAVRALRQASTPSPFTVMNSNQAHCIPPDQPTPNATEKATATPAHARGVLLLLGGDSRAWFVGTVLSGLNVWLLAQFTSSAPAETCPVGSSHEVPHHAPDVPAFGSLELPTTPTPASAGAGARYELVRFVWAPDGTLVFVEATVVAPPPGSPSVPLPNEAVPPDTVPPAG